MRILADGSVRRYEILPARGTDYVHSLLWDKQGRLWLAHESGIVIVVPPVASLDGENCRVRILTKTAFIGEAVSLPSAPAEARRYTIAAATNDNYTLALHRGSDDHIWIGALSNGLIEFDGVSFRFYGQEQGLNSGGVGTIAEDAGGNLWLGFGWGAVRLASNGFISYEVPEGAVVISIAEDRQHRIYSTDIECNVSMLDGERITHVQPDLKQWRDVSFCRDSLLDHSGDWWIATRGGLCRFSGIRRVEDLARVAPRVYRTTDGLSHNDVAALFEDSRGDIWISYFGPVAWPLTRWDRATGVFQHYSENDGLVAGDTPQAFLEDRRCNFWIGYRGSGLARLRRGRFHEIQFPSPNPPGGVSALMLDDRGRVWAATQRAGLLRIDDPDADHPSGVAYTMREGLSANSVRGVAADSAGRIYAVTAAGIDRMDLSTGYVRHYGERAGLSDFEVQNAFTDQRGTPWFGINRGLDQAR